MHSVVLISFLTLNLWTIQDTSVFFRAEQQLGWFRVEYQRNHKALLLSVWDNSKENVVKISKSVRGMFDLDTDPSTLLTSMSPDSFLSSFWAQHPGLRLARSWSAYESIFTTVLGQLVSVAFGKTLTHELIEATGTPARHPKTYQSISLFPSAKQILEADLSKVRTSGARRVTLRALAQAINNGSLNLSIPSNLQSLRMTLRSIPGVGLWTTEYVALRGFGDDDAFPSTDYVLKQELKLHPKINLDSIRPRRGYAAIALWKSFAESKRLACDVVA